MVRPNYPEPTSSCQLALQALRGHLLVSRTEERVTLLVDPINEPARRAYAKWGYEVVGRIQPFPDSPKFEAMVKELGQMTPRRRRHADSQ